jgi:N-acetylmuramoyl-L-alanine amidase
MKVGIDPGHGGTNIGCAGHGLREEVLTLQTAEALLDCLTATTGHEPVLSRARDETVSFAERGARLASCDFVVSIHYDTSASPTTGRMATYAFSNDDVSRQAGVAMLAAAPDVLRPVHPAIVFVTQLDWTLRAFNVLVHHRPRPALLVEVGFLSNPAHVEIIQRPGGMALIAAALTVGVSTAAELLGLGGASPPVVS